jgi:hypothetical protein
MLATLQPTKEQVRAYMRQRQRAFDRRPPPAPHEIRRQLGWHCSATDTDTTPADFPRLASASPLFFPGTIARLAALLAVEWCFLAAGIDRSN